MRVDNASDHLRTGNERRVRTLLLAVMSLVQAIRIRRLPLAVVVAGALFASACATASGRGSGEGATPPKANETDKPTYSKKEVLEKATGFFGDVSEGLAKAIEKAFSDNGQPVGYITGGEGGGAIGVGLRYGSGVLHRKDQPDLKVWWQGPSIGFDVGGSASKVFTLIYGLDSDAQLFQRFPSVEGSLYFVAGVGLTYQTTAGIVLAPIRTGVGARAGANIGYAHYTREKTLNPL